ncbi:MAG: structural cement protein Gp24 [Myxococcota bacterium]
MSQTSYTTYQSAAFAGMLADNGETDILSYVSEEASANLPFGVAVAKGTADNGMLAMVNGSSVIVGVLAHTHQVDPSQLASSPAGAGVPPKYLGNVLKRGRIVVQVEEAVTPASAVYVRHTAGAGGTQKGAIRASADTATAVAWTAARFLSSAGANGYAVLEVNLP